MSDRRARAIWRVGHLAIALAIVLTPAAIAEEPGVVWMGKQVVPKTPDFTLRVDPGAVELIQTGGVIYRVERVDGSRLWLRSGTSAGWAEAATVVAVDQAIEHFTGYIRDQPADPVGYMMRAMIWFEVRKEPGPALDDLDEVIRLVPKFAPAFLLRGFIQQVKKDYDEAIADFTEAIHLNPKNPDAFFSRGTVWSIKKQYDKAIADYDAAIRLNPKFAIAYINRGRTWRYKKEYDKALADHDESIRLDPKSAVAFVERGLLWIAKTEYDKAITDYDTASRLDPKYVWPQYCRAIIMLLTARDGAERDARKTIELGGWRGKQTPYAVVIGNFGARRMKHEDAAKALLDDAAKQCDTTAWPYPVVRYLRREIDESALLALADNDDKRTEVHCYLGLDHALAGRADKARFHYRWVVVHGAPRNVEYTITLAELDRLDAGVKR